MTWMLIVYLHIAGAHETVVMQEFNSQETCQAAGNRIWEFSNRRAYWSCLKK